MFTGQFSELSSKGLFTLLGRTVSGVFKSHLVMFSKPEGGINPISKPSMTSFRLRNSVWNLLGLSWPPFIMETFWPLWTSRTCACIFLYFQQTSICYTFVCLDFPFVVLHFGLSSDFWVFIPALLLLHSQSIPIMEYLGDVLLSTHCRGPGGFWNFRNQPWTWCIWG